MLIVSFDIATEKMQLSVEKNGIILASKTEFSTPQKYNSAMLIYDIIEIFEKFELSPNQINLITLNIGPGSFTGIRAGAVTARTIGQFLNIPIVGIPSLQLYSAIDVSEKPKIVLLDAKRNMLYTGIYDYNRNIIQHPTLKPKDIVLEEVKNFDGVIISERSLSKVLEGQEIKIIEESELDFSIIMLELAKKIIACSDNYREEYAWYNLKPLYLQTPAITIPKKTGIITK